MGVSCFVRVTATARILIATSKTSILMQFYSPGVLKAVANVNSIIAPALVKADIDVKDQQAIDDFLNALDGTPNKGKFCMKMIIPRAPWARAPT